MYLPVSPQIADIEVRIPRRGYVDSEVVLPDGIKKRDAHLIKGAYFSLFSMITQTNMAAKTMAIGNPAPIEM